MFIFLLDNLRPPLYFSNMFKTTSKTPKSEETRRLVMQKALEIFLQRGFDKSTLRELSKATGMSLGSFYYYFPSKESIVLAFYQENFSRFRAEAALAIASNRQFEKQLNAILEARIRTMEPEREIYLQLSRSATDPRSPLSPFSPETEEVRNATIAVFFDLIQDSDIKVPKAIAPFLPHLLWMAMMGVILFWTFDSSRGQSRTHRLIPMLSRHLTRFLRALNLPLVGKHILPFKEILTLFPELKPYEPGSKNANIGEQS